MDSNPHKPSEVVGQRVKEIRSDLGLSQRELAERLAEQGHPIHRTQLARLEAGGTLGAVDHLVALAVALGVTLPQLVAPNDDEAVVALTPHTHVPAGLARQWARGAAFLPNSDPAAFFAALPKDEQVELMRRHLTRGMSPLAQNLAGEQITERAEDLTWEITEGDRIRETERKKKGRNDG